MLRRGWAARSILAAATCRCRSSRGVARRAGLGAAAVAAAAAGAAWCAPLPRCDAPPPPPYDELGRPSAELVGEVCQWVAQRRRTGGKGGAEGWVRKVEQAAARPLRGKRVLVFVNPECGRKLAKAHGEEIVQPMLEALGCQSWEVIETDAKGSARELLHTADLSELDAVPPLPLEHQPPHPATRRPPG